MVKPHEVVHEIGAQTGLKVRGNVAFGRYNDFLVALHGQTGIQSSFTLLVGFPNRSDGPQIEEHLDPKALLKSVKCMGQVTVDDGIVRVIFTPSLRVPEAAKVKGLMDSVVETVGANASPFGPDCESCGRTPADVVLVNGSPILSCEDCLERLRGDAETAVSAVQATAPNLKRGLAFGFAAAFGAAFVYGLVSGILQYYFFFAGILVGLAVGYALSYGAERITGEVIGVAILLTIFAVVLGEVFYVAITLLTVGAPLSALPEAFILYLEVAPGEFLLSLVMGLAGAGYIAYRLYGAGKAQVPGIEITT